MDLQRAPTTLDDVRLAIFRQHTQLTQLIDELEGHAMAVLGGGERAALNEAIDLLDTRFVRHLEYEEAHLARWLPQTDADQSLRAGHDEQRLTMRGLVHDRNVFADRRTLARAVLAVVHHLRKYMADEDAGLRALR
ncbi:MAG: hypothetical protein JWP87_6309 [Labilithrix sp.]|nr:hypothetical protein [Labilithrix sp.]